MSTINRVTLLGNVGNVEVKEFDKGRKLVDYEWDRAADNVRTNAGEVFRRWRCFHGFTEDTARVLWCSHGQLLLEPASREDFVHKGKISAEVPTKQFRGLTAHLSCLLPRQ